MTLTHADRPITAPLQFRRAIYVYDREAKHVDWSIEGETLIQVYPASAPPGYLQNCTRALLPVEVQEALRRDFLALRRLAEIAEAAQPGAPIEHPQGRWMTRHIRQLYFVIAALASALTWAIGSLGLPG